jgi:hypothetical protein
MKVSLKYFFAVIGTNKLPNNVAGHANTLLGMPKARLHLMLHNGAD